VLQQDTDPFFAKNMYLNFGDLGQNAKEYVEQYASKRQGSKEMNSIADMKRFVEEYPEFRKLSSNVTKHITLVGELSRRVAQDTLLDVSELEQSLACNDNHSQDLKVITQTLTMCLTSVESSKTHCRPQSRGFKQVAPRCDLCTSLSQIPQLFTTCVDRFAQNHHGTLAITAEINKVSHHLSHFSRRRHFSWWSCCVWASTIVPIILLLRRRSQPNSTWSQRRGKRVYTTFPATRVYTAGSHQRPTTRHTVSLCRRRRHHTRQATGRDCFHGRRHNIRGSQNGSWNQCSNSRRKDCTRWHVNSK
jgi:Sec1 family